VDRGVIKTMAEPLSKQGGLVALFGSLAPNGAILKRSAADANLFEKEGRAVVFSSLDDLAARVDDPSLDVKPDDFMVLQNAGPKSGYAMPEAGYLPIPAKLAKAGVKDMVRISDARMSGTAYGTIVLHVSPEAAVGGPLALVKNGDRIKLSVRERRIELLVDEKEIQKRKSAWKPPVTARARLREAVHGPRAPGEHGCDFDFLRKARASGSRSGCRSGRHAAPSPSRRPSLACRDGRAAQVDQRVAGRLTSRAGMTRRWLVVPAREHVAHAAGLVEGLVEVDLHRRPVPLVGTPAPCTPDDVGPFARVSNVRRFAVQLGRLRENLRCGEKRGQFANALMPAVFPQP
jgi:hypothetical protein